MEANKPDSSRQKELYEQIHDEYDAHYYDGPSRAFRERFMWSALLEGLDLGDSTVADLACGSGVNTQALLARCPHVRPVGFDISAKACEAYRQNTGFPAHELDLTKGIDPGIQVDVAMVWGGLHHCVADLDGTFRTLAALVKPGGLLLMSEPNRNYFLESARSLWYRMDPYFDASTEAALDHDAIAQRASKFFTPEVATYKGGPAYFLIYNSLILRVPKCIKGAIAPPLFVAESLYNQMPGKVWYPYFLARWRRNKV
jgi:SAM-dependent methyltransferase